MELNKRAFGLTAGLIWGLSVMLITWWLLFNGSPGTSIAKISVVYRGYSYSFIGSIIGFVWGFVDGFIVGFVFAWLYNLLNKPKKTA